MTTLVSGEQRYGRGRPVQRRLTGQSASAVYTLARRVVRDQDRVDVGADCPIHSMVREFYDYIIGDAPLWGDPVG